MYYTYILYNIENDVFYIGSTYSLKKRMFEHRNGLGNYTSRYSGQWKLVYYEAFSSRAEAMSREKELKKKKSKSYLKWLIKSKRAQFFA